MAEIFDLAGLSKADYEYALRSDQELVYTATNDYLTRASMAAMDAMQFFVGNSTTQSSMQYQLPITGRDEPIRSDEAPARLRRTGSWEVGCPINTYKSGLAQTPVNLGYITVSEFQAHADGLVTRYRNTNTADILESVFDNTSRTWQDPEMQLPSTTVRPLANGDAVIYPPTLGTYSGGSTDDHYLVSGYTSANISDTNNPFPTIAEELIEHFGRQTAGENIVALINHDEQNVVEGLSNFFEVEDSRVELGDDVSTLRTFGNIPGKIIGRVGSVTISVWDYIPSGYIFAKDNRVEAPLMRRIDPAGTNLGGGSIVNREPLLNAKDIQFNNFMYRYGYGVGNRLNGVVMQLKASGTYDVPTIG